MAIEGLNGSFAYFMEQILREYKSNKNTDMKMTVIADCGHLDRLDNTFIMNDVFIMFNVF